MALAIIAAFAVASVQDGDWQTSNHKDWNWPINGQFLLGGGGSQLSTGTVFHRILHS